MLVLVSAIIHAMDFRESTARQEIVNSVRTAVMLAAKEDFAEGHE